MRAHFILHNLQDADKGKADGRGSEDEAVASAVNFGSCMSFASESERGRLPF